ncbi:pleckstrin homology domain-containing family G member 3 isoform X2 [Hoplias malabaricus]
MPEDSQSDVPMGEESPRLSTVSVSSSDRVSVCSDVSDAARPVSLVSTVSFGSGSSRDDFGSSGAVLTTDDELDLLTAENQKNPENPRPADPCVQNRDCSEPVIPFASKAMAPNPQLSYLDRVVMEIIETERMYVRDLRSIVEDYLAHIIDTADLQIGPEQVCALFGNIEDIYEFNSDLLQALDQCENDPVDIARCFVLKSEYFEIYTQYCTNYPNSVAALTDCMRNKTLGKFFRDRQASLKHSLPLGSYLLKPVQRILKYHLLLQEIAKHFDSEEEGYEVVEEAIYTMTAVAWYINDMKRKHEHAIRLQEVQSLLINWKGQDLTTYGELVLEGTFRVHRAKNERTLFLFERMLLITKRRGEHYVYKTHILCSTLMLIESAKDSLCFSVTHYKQPKQPHTVQARTVEERKLWAHHIKRLILENHQAFIPQKAKEAILEMDSIYPRYRYSPERLKKVMSHQSDDVSRGRRGRRPIELTKQKLKTSKALVKDTDVTEENCRNRDVQDRPGEGECGLGQKQYSGLQISEIHSDDSRGGSTEELQLKVVSEAEPTETEPQIKNQDREEHDKVKEDKEEACPPLPQDVTPGESSDEEEDGQEVQSSILPSSVLDKAGIIAEHFVGSVQRVSLSGDEVRSLGCPSPHSPSRTGSSLSLSESRERPYRRGSTSSEVPQNQDPDLSLLAARDDNLFDSDRGIQRRRDSTLSRQDQLLINKIRSYYENAEHQDAAFCLRRRESLTYIPTGLVRNSVSRLNSMPKDSSLAVEKVVPDRGLNLESSSVSSSVSEPNLSTQLTDPFRNLLASSISTETSGFNSYRDATLCCSEVDSSANLKPEEIFRPSSEMIKVWQDMEREVCRSQQELRTLRPKETPLFRGDRAAPGQSKGPDLEEGDNTLLSEVLSPITEESSASPPGKGRGRSLSRASSLNDAVSLRPLEGDGRPMKSQIPRILQLRAEDQGLGAPPSETSTSKVINLARRYSQRIRTSHSSLQLRNWDTDTVVLKRNLSSVAEEKHQTEIRGKSALSLSLCDDVTPEPNTHSDTSHKRSHSKSPRTPPSAETFDWPDVRELCSKYTPSSLPPAGQTQKSTEPELTADRGPKRRSSCSSGSKTEPRDSRTQPENPHVRTHRAGSLDQKLAGLFLSDLQNPVQGQQEDQNQIQNLVQSSGYYVSAETSLPNDKRIIVLEKVLHRETEEPAAEGEPCKEPAVTEVPAVKEELCKEPVMEPEPEEDDEQLVQIRSPTSREKICIKAVIERCRVYQESEEYRHREEQRSRTDRNKEPDRTPASAEPTDPAPTHQGDSGKKTDPSQQSVVKNLREKFLNLR